MKPIQAVLLAAAIAGWAVLHWTRPGLVPTLAAITIAMFVYLSAGIIFRNKALRDLLDLWHALVGQRTVKPIH